MFWLALIVEAGRGQEARKNGAPRVFDRVDEKYPSLEKAWLHGYDNPDADLLAALKADTERLKQENSKLN